MELGRNAKRFISALLAFVMVLSWVPGSALTAQAAETGLCDHHTEHTAQCGYRAAAEGAPCKYDGLCDKGCVDSDGDGQTDHARDCAYTRELEKDLCGQGCRDADGDSFADHAESCAFTQAKGRHEHDGKCGYAEADAGSPCAVQCEQCAAKTAAPLTETAPETTAEATVPETTEAAVSETTEVTVSETTEVTVPETTEATVPEETSAPIQQLQELIDALPEHDTEDNREAVTAQLQEILSRYAALTEAEQEQIDITPCLLLQEELDGANTAMPLEGNTYVLSGNCTGDHTGWTAWTSDLELPTAPGNYYLTKDVSVWIGEGQKYWRTPGGETTICLNGHHILNASTPSSGGVNNSYLIAVTNDGTLNLHDCQGSGYIERSGSSYGAICVFPDAVFNMYGGSIRNSGIGVYVEHEKATLADNNKGAHFNMYGGTISGCGTASVYVNSRVMKPDGGFYMYGGTLGNQVTIVNLEGKYNSNNFNTLHYFGGTIYGDPQVFISNNKSIYVGAPLSVPLRLKVNEKSGFTVPDGKLVVAEPGYTLTEEDALWVMHPGETRIPVVDTASNSIVLKEVVFLGDGLSLESVSYGQKANEAVIHGSATIDGSTELAGRLWIADETVYNAGTHEIEVKFQVENRSEELSYPAALTVNKVAPNLAWADDKLNQTVAKPRVRDEFTAPTTNSDGKVSYAYRAADAADTAVWTDGLPSECGTYVVKAKQEEGTNHTAAESSNTVTLSVADVPGKPTVHAAALSDAQAEITWDAPDYVGSSPITGWEVTWLRKGREAKKTETLPADARSAIFTLTDKSENDWYQCEVKAINAAGAGEAGFRSPIYVSMKPVITRISVIRFNRKDYVEGEKLDTQEVQVLLMYNYKSESNPLSGYVPLEQAVEMGAKLILDGMDAPPKEIDYKEYILTLADNRSSLYLDMPTDLAEQTIRYNAGTITVGISYPGAPQNLKVTPGDQKLTVTWEEPAITYGKETTGYIIQCVDKNNTEVYSREVDAATHQVVLGSLTNEETYTVHIRARNKDGYGETATIEGKPSPYATIRLTPKAQIVFGDNVRDWIDKLDETYSYTIDNNTDLETLTGLTVEFESEATQLAEGDKLQVTFEKKIVDSLDWNYTPRVDITPAVKVIGPDGNEKTTHHYTFITPTAELEYLPRDISKDTCGITYLFLTDNRYDGSNKIITGSHIGLTLNGSDTFPNGRYIRQQDYTCEALDQNGNPVEEIYLPGTYTVIITGTGSCTGTYQTTLTIKKRDTIVKANNQTVEYGTAISSDTAMARLTSCGWQDFIKEITLTPESNQVGTWEIIPSDAHIWNTDANEERTEYYNITAYQPGTLTITKAENPTVAFKKTSITMEYNNGDPIPNPTEDMLTFTGAYYEDIRFQWQDEHGNVLDSAPTEMGSYTLRAYLEDNANHGAAEDTVSVKVGGKQLNEANMTLAEGPFTYNGMAHAPTVTVKDGETVIDTSRYTVTYANNTNAGTATVTVADDDGTDIYEISGTLSFTIDPCPLDGLTASVNNPGSIVYDGTEQTPGVTVTGSNGTALTADTDYTVAYTDNLNAGTATAAITAVGSGNYTGTKEIAFTIAQKPVTPVLSGTAAKVYDGTKTVPAGLLTVTLQGVLEADADKLTASATMTYNSANVADADTITAAGITLSGAASGNYVLSATEITTGGTITKKAPAISFTDQIITFGDMPTEAAADSNGAFSYSYVIKDSTMEAVNGWPENAGTYTVTAAVAETDNYFSGSASVTLTVNRKPIPVPEAVPGLIYNGRIRTGVEAGTGYTLTGSTAKDVGNYNATVTLDGNHIWQLAGGSSEADQTIAWNIKQKDITVDITANGGTYSGEPFPASATLSGTVEGETVPVTLTYAKQGVTAGSTDAPKDAGSYTVTATITDSNYSLTGPNSKDFTIAQADITGASVTVNGTYTYTGTAQTPDPTVTLGGKTLVKDTDYTVSYTDNTDAGTAAVTVTGTGNYTGEAAKEFTVDKATVTDVSTTVNSVNAPEAQGAVQRNVTAGSGYTGTITWNPADSQYGFNTAYTAILTLTPDGNHVFGELTPKGWTVTASEDGTVTLTKTFGKTRLEKITGVTKPTNQTLTTHNPDPSGVSDQLPQTVTVTTETGTGDLPITWSCDTYVTTPKAVNTFTWKVTDVGNYDASEVKLTDTITVTNPDPSPVTITGKDASVPYDGTAIDVSALFTIDEHAGAAIYNVVNGTGTGTFDGSTLTVTKAGTFTVTVSTAAQGIYAAGTATATLTVNKGTGTGSVKMEGWTYGETAKDPVPSSDTNRIDNVTYTYSQGGTTVAKPTKAGTYTVTAAFGATEVYDECTASADFTIAPKPITVTITPNGGVEGQAITGAAAELSGLVEGDSDTTAVTLTYTKKGETAGSTDLPKDAGTYTVTASVENRNYVLTEETAAEFIVRRPITATIQSLNKTYGDPDPELTCEVTAGDLLEGIPLNITMERKAGEKAGEYGITAPNAAADNPNYELTLVEGKLTIDRKNIKDAEVVLGPTLIANGEAQTQTVQSVTVKNGQGKDMEATYTVTGNTKTNAGVYQMTITGTGNFTGEIQQTFVIAPAAGQPMDTDDSGNPVLGAGTIIEKVINDKDAPTMSLGTSKAEIAEILIKDGSVTAQELAQVANGENLEIVLTVEDSNSVPAEDRNKIKALAKGYTVGCWLDISLYKQLGDGEPEPVHWTGKPITLTAQIPENLLPKKNETRTYRIVRCHDGEAKFLETEYDDGKLTFETDRFSSYAIVYTAKKLADKTSPRTGDSFQIELWITVMTLSAAGIGTVMTAKRKKQK